MCAVLCIGEKYSIHNNCTNTMYNMQQGQFQCVMKIVYGCLVRLLYHIAEWYNQSD